MRCPACNVEMQFLLTTAYCPNECEKKPSCPDCSSKNTEPFDPGGFLDSFSPKDSRVTYHCWPCGAVWNDQKPETD